MAYGNDKSISQASAKGKVKWFNATKGYGFITLDNGGDAFCHASALQATGHSDVQPGTTIVCDLADSPRGLQVVSVHSVDISTAEAPWPEADRDLLHGRNAVAALKLRQDVQSLALAPGPPRRKRRGHIEAVVF